MSQHRHGTHEANVKAVILKMLEVRAAPSPDINVLRYRLGFLKGIEAVAKLMEWDDVEEKVAATIQEKAHAWDLTGTVS